MANTAVGTLSSTTSTAPTTLAIAAVAAVGDVRVLRAAVVSTTIQPTAVSGGNCSSWTQGFDPANDNQGTVRRHAVWYGTVANANSSQHETITITWSASVTGITIDLDCLTFSAGNTATTWARDGATLTIVNNASSTTITYPTATAGGTGRVYAGFARAPSGGSYGTPSGGTTQTDANGNPAIYLLNAGSGSVAPTQTSTATTSNAAGLLLVPSSVTVYTQTLSATTAGVASISKIGMKPLSATTAAVPSLSKLARATRSATTTGVPSLTKVARHTLNATTTGVASVLSNKVFTQTLSAITTALVTAN